MDGRFGRAAACAALVILSTALAMSQRATAQQQNAQQTAAADPAKIDLGKAIFAEKCSHCHGPNMVNSGTITPDLRRFPDDQPRFIDTVKHGKNNRMPPWGDVLSNEDIADLWAYISSRRSQ